MENLTKVIEFLKTLPTWSRITIIVAMALVAIALSSCAKRTYQFKLNAEKLEMMYKDSLNFQTLKM